MSQPEFDFWQEVESLIPPQQTVIVEYRLYYNEMGEIYLCAMLQQDYPLAGNYLVVDKQTYEKNGLYHIVDGLLTEVDFRVANRVKLKKGNSEYRVVKNHAGVILEKNEICTDIEYYDKID